MTGPPSDVPGDRPAELAALDVLVGTWEMEAFFAAGFLGPDSPEMRNRSGSTTFEWLYGEFFLVQRFTAPSPAPSGIAIIGAHDSEGLSQHYYDSRGVGRVYRTSLESGVWRLWRDAPGMCQRYAGEISADGGTINGAWDISPDGRDWQHDFDLAYFRVS